MTKYYYEDHHSAFSLVEESDCFKIRTGKTEIEEHHVEEFLDKTVEWLSSNPDKSLVIDFDGVKWVCSDFLAQLIRYYEDSRARGLIVRLVNVDPSIQAFLDGTGTLVVSLPSKRPVLSVSTWQALQDIRNQLSDQQIMEKHGLSKWGLRSLFKKLVAKGVISSEELQERKANPSLQLIPEDEESESRTLTISASDLVRDVTEGMPNEDLMRKYKLSRKDLQRVLDKLLGKSLVSEEAVAERREHKN